jgi:hypothetical protein
MPPITALNKAEARLDAKLFCAFDLETHKLGPGNMAPPIVCGSFARWLDDGKISCGLTEGAEASCDFLKTTLEAGQIIVGANIAYDLACCAAQDESLLPLIFRALRGGQIYDVQIAQSLDAIAGGHLAKDPRRIVQKEGEEPQFGDLRDPSSGRPSKRYSLATCVDLVLGRVDAKKNDAWRTSYALLEGIPVENWPEEARQYPVDDACNTLEVATKQVRGWTRGKHDGYEGPCRNLGNLPEQVEAAFSFHLGACWGLRVDGERLGKLEVHVAAQHEKTLERFRALGWIRPDGTEDSVAIKRAVAAAYGAHGECPACKGTGSVRQTEKKPCRGPKVKNRYVGCVAGCAFCGGKAEIEVLGPYKTCKAAEGGCDGTGLDLKTAPLLPRSDKGSIKTDRDAMMESADDNLSDFSDNTFEKIRVTYIPYLRKGVERPLSFSPNVLVASGRCSYENSPVHQFPRKGGVRECITARPGWVLASTDYAAGELCTLAQVTRWMVGHSRMASVINDTKDPGSLHTYLAARMIGEDFDSMRARVKAKDKRASDFRQAAKCFHPDTEILTRKGWVRIADLTLEDEVASVVPDKHITKGGKVERRCLTCKTTFYVKRSEIERGSGFFCSRACYHAGRNLERPAENKRFDREPANLRIEWAKPERLTTRKAEGLVHIKNESIDLRVTPDHPMIAYGATNQLLLVEAKDFGSQRGWFNAGTAPGHIEVDERLLRLAVATQADGNYIIGGVTQRNVRLGFSKKRKVDRLTALLEPGDYTVSVCKNGDYGDATRFKLSEDLSDKIKSLLDADKTLPWWWLNLTPALREAAVDEAKYWDGSQREGMTGYHYSTTIKKNADVLQALASVTNRKATFVSQNEERDNPEHAKCYVLSVKAKPDSRGGNVEVTHLDYTGDVYCLTVPSGCVLVRDQGKPVVSHNCGNFGLPGGMGSATFVLAKRKKSEGMTTSPDGAVVYAGIRFCILLEGAERCGVEKVTRWGKREIMPTCKRCIEAVESVLKPAFFDAYPEVREYLNIVGESAEDGVVNQLAWSEQDKRVVVIRRRGGVGYTDGANSAFQGLLADIGKRAFCQMTREAYLGVKDDGSPSPLAGARFPLFIHDEPLAELREETAHLSGPRIAEIMISCGKELAPDVYWFAEPALSRFLSKDAEPMYDGTGRLVVWQPKEKE